MSSTSVSQEGKRVFTITRQGPGLVAAVEDLEMWKYRCGAHPEEKRRVVYSQVLREEEKRSVHDLKYEWTAVGKILETPREELFS
jgi:hypothetical protein